MSADHSTPAAERITIYALCEPDTLEPRYVGKAKNLAARLRVHWCEARSGRFHTRKDNWLRSLGGRKPTVVTLAEVGPDEWEAAERFWIAEMRRRGHDLTNFSDGGDTSPVEGKRHTEEAKEKMRQAAIRNGARPPSRKGEEVSAETRAKMSATRKRKGLKPPPMGGWNKGVRRTHCPQGHEYTPENTRLVVRRDRTTPAQQCRTCAAEQYRRDLAKRRPSASGG